MAFRIFSKFTPGVFLLLSFSPLILVSVADAGGGGVALSGKGAGDDAGVGAKKLEHLLLSYQKSSGVKMRVKKLTVNGLIGTERKSQGRALFKAGKLRLEIESPEKSLLIMDGKTIWFVQPQPTMDGAESFLVSKMSGQSLKRSSAVMAAIFDGRKILRQFRVVKFATIESVEEFELEPRRPQDSDVIRLQIKASGPELQSVTFWDQSDNRVSYDFSDVDFKAKLDAKEFSYAPPKNADVVEY